MIAAITPFFLGPGVVLLYYGWKARRTEEVLVDFTTRVRMYRRIGLDDLARLFGRTRPDIEKLLAQAIDRGLLNGVVDRASNEFVLRETFGQQVFVEKCPSCGGRVGRWSFPEERFTCPLLRRLRLRPRSLVTRFPNRR